MQWERLPSSFASGYINVWCTSAPHTHNKKPHKHSIAMRRAGEAPSFYNNIRLPGAGARLQSAIDATSTTKTVRQLQHWNSRRPPTAIGAMMFTTLCLCAGREVSARMDGGRRGGRVGKWGSISLCLSVSNRVAANSCGIFDDFYSVHVVAVVVGLKYTLYIQICDDIICWAVNVCVCACCVRAVREL